jgi:hypothetical protein
MKRIVCILLISAILPVLNVGATEYDVAWLWADHKKSVDGEIRYRMIPVITLDSGSVNAFLDLPDMGLTFDLPYVSEAPLDPSWYEHFSVFYDPPPGDSWKTAYQFRTDDGLTTPLFSHATTKFAAMDFVQAQITGKEYPTITWDPVTDADEYRVRLYNPDNDTLLFNETIADDGSPSYSYTYTGDLFVQYDYLWVVLEARDYEGSQLLNRSKIYYEHSVTPVGEYLIMLKLKNVPESLTFYQDYVGDNILEHGWGVDIDTDNNASTGNSQGFDVQISINNYKIPGMAPTIMSIMDATRKHTWIYSDPSPTMGPGTIGHPIRAEIDTNANTIKMIVREDFAELADLDITDRFRFTAYYQSPTGFTPDNTSENLPGSNMVSDPEGDVVYDFIDILEGKIEYRPIWGSAYKTLFDNSSDLELFRQYRDERLTSTADGRKYNTLLYRFSRQALQVFLRNPELMAQAKSLIEANRGAVMDVRNGDEGVIYNTAEIADFLDAYARKSPPGLKILAHLVRWDMLRKQRQGQLFHGFRLR